MTHEQMTFDALVRDCTGVVMADRQEPLVASYLEDPERSLICDGAKTTSARVPANVPLYGEVEAGHVGALAYEVGVHKAVGGRGDFPVPGDILSAALASCLDSCIRIIANRLGVELTWLSVEVVAHIDVRGALRVDNKTPVGFQDMDVLVDMKAEGGVPETTLDVIVNAAEYSCVIMQTLRNSPNIAVRRASLEVARSAA